MPLISRMSVVLVLAPILWAQGNTPADVTNKPVVPDPAHAPTIAFQDSTKLEPIQEVKAIYPPEAKAKRIEGTATIRLSVDETGIVDKTEVISGEPLLAASCAEALHQWKFKPFIKGGQAIRVSAALPCKFALSNDAPLAPPVQDLSDTPKPKTSQNPGGSEPATSPNSESLVLIKKVKATYPIEAERDKTQGQVVLKVLVDEMGDVAQTTVVSGNSILASSAVDAVKKWRFEPFVRNGKAIKVSTVVSYDFAFEDRIIADKLNDPAAMAYPPPASDGTAPSPAPPQSIRASGSVMQGLCIYKVGPVYPPEAKRVHVQGAVVLAAVIGRDGRIKDLRAVSGPGLLVDAAVGAVQQWRYRPYLLLGNPVEVQTTITVNFQLGP